MATADEFLARCEMAATLRASGLTLKATGQKLGGLSVERVRQMEAKYVKERRYSYFRPMGMRTINCLNNVINGDERDANSPKFTAAQVAEMTAQELMASPNFGAGCLKEVEAWLATFDLALSAPVA